MTICQLKIYEESYYFEAYIGAVKVFIFVDSFVPPKKWFYLQRIKEVSLISLTFV